MEIEAKFTAPDWATLQRLILVERLAGFVLTPAHLKQLHDRYLDTADGGFLRGGYACRLREDREGQSLLTLKSLTPAQGALHARQELEVQLARQAGLDTAGWPDCAAKFLALELSHGQPLTPLFDLRQERYQRLATPAGHAIPDVELSIDRASSCAAGQDELLGVEVELLPDRNRAALDAIVEALQQGWGLVPEPISKFERCLAQARPELIPLLRAR